MCFNEGFLKNINLIIEEEPTEDNLNMFIDKYGTSTMVYAEFGSDFYKKYQMDRSNLAYKRYLNKKVLFDTA